MAASSYCWLGAVMATSTGDTKPSAGGAAASTEDTAYSATTEGVGATAGVVGSANEAAASAPLLPKTGVTSVSAIRPA